jgi:probable F420-dependent oxidoreductase
MKIGVFIFSTEYSIRMVDLARALEERGFESLFVPEHTHIPLSRRTPFPGGEPLPREYFNTLDPFVDLTAAAVVTQTLRIGTGICLVSQRDPIVTAKAVASLDLISEGRFEFGIGAGWNQDELENHGTRYEDRFRVMVDRVKAMQAIWTGEEASYDGEFTHFESAWLWPKPVQKPYPPILLGGETKYSLRRVMEFCDGWMPRGNNMTDPKAAMEKLRGYADEAGRDMDSIAVSVFRAPPKEDYLAKCQEAGIMRVLLQLPSAGQDVVMPLLDQYAALQGA